MGGSSLVAGDFSLRSSALVLRWGKEGWVSACILTWHIYSMPENIRCKRGGWENS